MNKDYALIADLTRLPEVKDDNLMIIEDIEDTKRATVLDFKKSLSGDYKEPSDTTFYSSKKIESYMKELNRSMSTLASDTDVKNISKRIEDIIAGSGDGTKDSELIDARDGEDTLKLRLDRDIRVCEDKHIKKIYREIEGTTVSTGTFGYVDIYVPQPKGPDSTLIIKSKNILDVNNVNNVDGNGVSYTGRGFIYEQTTVDNLTVSLKFDNSVPKGKYYFFSKIIADSMFEDSREIKFVLVNTRDESAYTEFVFDQISSKFEFEAPKAFNEIRFVFNADKFVANSILIYTDLMLMASDKYEDTYMPYYYYETNAFDNNKHHRIYSENYDITTNDGTNLIVGYYDNEVTFESLYNDIKKLKNETIDNRDKCGLIENYGDYLFFDNAVCETPTSCRLSYDEDKYVRNGKPSLKVTFAEDITEVNPVIALEMTDHIESIESVSLAFYIDKTVSYYFSTQEPIKICLSSDGYNEPEMVNYYSISLNKNELIQGWNIIKRNLNEFTSNGLPNSHSIKYVKIEIGKDRSLDNMSMYFNSVIFNQRMKPTVLLAFDGIYKEGIEYTYPYLTNKNIPATILANNRTTFDSAILNEIVDLRILHGWDIGQYGCNPNKELLTKDDNSREQYLALKNSKEWLQANFIYSPVSYSAPSGNLRPITIPILKDLGYKIAKTNSTGYCNFFDPKFDFAIPMHLFSRDTTEAEILEKLQYAIDNNCCICLYTNNVTNYGDEISSKKVLLEAIVKFITDNSDKLTAMTLSEFYNKCNS